MKKDTDGAARATVQSIIIGFGYRYRFPCLFFGYRPFPELGIMDAAVATSIGRGLGVAFQFYQLAKKSNHIRIMRKHIII